MADKKISQLTALSAANLAPSTDVLAIVDTSATETKKIAAQDIVNGVLNVASAVGIGTASPASKLHVAGNARIVNADARLDFFATAQQWAVQVVDSDKRFRIINETSGSGSEFILTTSGNLGLGVTPSAWGATHKAFTLGSSGNQSSISGQTDANRLNLISNGFFNGTNWIYGNGVGSGWYRINQNAHEWYTSSNTPSVGNVISFTQAMTLDASGNLGLGNTNPASYGGFVAQLASGIALHSNSVSGVAGLNLYENGTGRFSLRTLNGSAGLSFYDSFNATERGRFTAGGYFKASNDGTYNGSTANYHELKSTTAGLPSTFIQNTNANPYGAVINFTSSPDNNSNYFLNCEDGTTVRCYIWSDGDLANHDGVYGTISDERLKQDIVDASSQWDDLKAIRFRKYRMKTDVEANPDAPAMFGVVAQELAQVCPGLVDEHPNMKTVEVTDEEGNVTQTQEPDGTTTLTVKSSILLMKAAKALQEAMARIESLEADMAALKASA